MPTCSSCAAEAPVPPGSPAAPRPALRQRLRSSAQPFVPEGLCQLAQLQSFEVPLTQPRPATSHTQRAPPGLEQTLLPLGVILSGALATPAAPPAHSATAALRKAGDPEGSDCCSTSAGQDGESSEAPSETEDSTTMVILNIPHSYSKQKLQKTIETAGFAFDYLHFPQDSRRGKNRGFAFVNFAAPETARAFRRAFDNIPLVNLRGEEKPIAVVPSSLQGFERNRAMHPRAARPLSSQ